MKTLQISPHHHDKTCFNIQPYKTINDFIKKEFTNEVLKHVGNIPLCPLALRQKMWLPEKHSTKLLS